MKIEVYSLKDIVTRIEPNDNIISIRDQGISNDDVDRYSFIDRVGKSVNANVLPITFDDVDKYRFKHGMEHPRVYERINRCGGNPIYFSKEHAQQIVNWARELWEKDNGVRIKVHCWAGRSRSQAVAYWLNIYFNLVLSENLTEYHENNRRNVHRNVHFNCEVLKVLTRIYG